MWKVKIRTYVKMKNTFFFKFRFWLNTNACSYHGDLKSKNVIYMALLKILLEFVNNVPVLHTHFSPRKNEYILVFPPERSVYTHFSPRKDQYILIFPPDF